MTNEINFDTIFEKIYSIEGGHSKDSSDSGGETAPGGITERVARANGYFGPMAKMPKSEVQRIFKTQYWDILNLDKVAEISPRIAEELVDIGYNCGVGIAGKFFQRSLNVFNRNEFDYQDVKVDSLIGPMTIQAFKLYYNRRKNQDGETVLLRALNGLQAARYIEIAEVRKKDERFTFGWFKNRIKFLFGL